MYLQLHCRRVITTFTTTRWPLMCLDLIYGIISSEDLSQNHLMHIRERVPASGVKDQTVMRVSE